MMNGRAIEKEDDIKRSSKFIISVLYFWEMKKVAMSSLMKNKKKSDEEVKQ